ncbi:MAG: zinc-binding dehydrogenase [Actinomycetia bacterium]|nr:zinc-binding dehydrogenase [Actinomycetes bacterium]
MKVRAALIMGAGAPLEVIEGELREPETGEVRVRIDASGVCRSDLHAGGTGEQIGFPAVLGHEGAGVIEAVGPGSRLAVGDHVVLSWSPKCGTCPRCVEGRPNLCQGLITNGTAAGFTFEGRPVSAYMGVGSLAEQVIVTERRAVPVPADLPSEALCLIGCGVATGWGAAVRTAGTAVGDRVAVFGCGGVGLSAIQGAREAGAVSIIAVDPDAGRRDLAMRLGATSTIDSDAVNATQAVLEQTTGGADIAIEATGHPEVMSRLLDSVRPGGKAVIIGLPAADAMVTVSPFHLLYEKNLTGSIYGSVDPHIEFPIMAELYRQGRLDIDSLRGNTFTLDQVNDAIAELAEQRSPRPLVLPNAE